MAQYEVTLRDYWRIMRRRKAIVIFTVFLLGFFSFLIATLYKDKPIYKTTSKVQINSPETIASINAQYMGMAGGGLDTDDIGIAFLAGRDQGLEDQHLPGRVLPGFTAFEIPQGVGGGHHHRITGDDGPLGLQLVSAPPTHSHVLGVDGGDGFRGIDLDPGGRLEDGFVFPDLGDQKTEEPQQDDREDHNRLPPAHDAPVISEGYFVLGHGLGCGWHYDYSP